MRKPRRRTGTFRPGTSELEKVHGVSALVFGGLAGALAIVDQSIFVDVGMVPFAPRRGGEQASENVTFDGSLAPEASLKPPENVVATPRSIVTSKTPPSDPPAPAVVPAKVDGGDLIRPLSLPPSTPLQAATDTRPQQPLNRGDNGGAGSAVGPAMIVTPPPGGGQVAAPASGGSQSPPEVMAVVAALGGAGLGVSGASPSASNPPHALSATPVRTRQPAG
jgi:hypothetical protein